VAEILRLRSYQPLHCKQLFRSNSSALPARRYIGSRSRERSIFV
jgi:hypothetical protein